MNETNHPARRLRHGERPTEPLVFEDAAANKAAEEGGLPEMPRNYGRFNINGPDEHRIRGWTGEQMKEYALKAIAADRASRQVANKAEVEPVRQPIGYITTGDIEYGSDGAEVGDWDIEFDRKVIDAMPEFAQPETTYAVYLEATPPATTGASTALPLQELHDIVEPYAHSIIKRGFTKDQQDERLNAIAVWMEREFSARIDAAVSSKVGASTVLTDERILNIWADVTVTHKVGCIFPFAREIAREVAAQAGQVAVPEAAIWNAITRLGRTDSTQEERFAAADSLRAIAAPSPAKESK